MKVLAVASELYPLVKTGGLADVTGALPQALAAHGVAVTTLLPGYPAVLARIAARRTVHRYTRLFGGPAKLLRARFESVDLFVLDAPALFDRGGGPYADANGQPWPDNWQRFAALSRAAADIAEGAVAGYRPDLVHGHDWQAAMTMAYLRYGGASPVPGVMTVHNLAFQGWTDGRHFAALGLPEGAFTVDGVEYHGGVGYLKAGLQNADAITTVSPRYAEEILTPEHGMGLDGLLRARADRLIGIVNGIDTHEWNPATDPSLRHPYGRRSLARRRRNRPPVEAHFGLDQDDGLLFCVISRLTGQKGIDLLADGLDDLVATGSRLAVLGSGDAALEDALRAAAARHPGRIGVIIGYDETWSHRLQAGADAILIPSRFEPCGLTQLYGLRYGCVPVVAHTGGLADTIIDANAAAVAAGVATGLQFRPADTAALRRAVRQAATLYRQRDPWTALQRQGMKADFSWERSAARYAVLFRTLTTAGGPA